MSSERQIMEFEAGTVTFQAFLHRFFDTRHLAVDEGGFVQDLDTLEINVAEHGTDRRPVPGVEGYATDISGIA